LLLRTSALLVDLAVDSSISPDVVLTSFVVSAAAVNVSARASEAGVAFFSSSSPWLDWPL